jgi:hypothetical protein
MSAANVEESMTNWVEWFTYQLKASGDGLLWAFSRIEPIFHDQLPPFPGYMGTWTPARHVWHVTDYERVDVIPAMRLWLGEALPEDEHDEEAAWAAVTDRSYEALAAGFRAVRQEQIALLQALAAVDWAEERQTDWGMKPLSMVVTKTFQHTYEHGDTLLRMGLWWHGFPER